VHVRAGEGRRIVGLGVKRVHLFWSSGTDGCSPGGKGTCPDQAQPSSSRGASRGASGGSGGCGSG
jgi:hypothetical protein